MRRLLLAAVLAALPFCAHAQVIGPTGVTVVGDTSSNLVSGPYKLLFNGATVSNAGNGVAEITFTNDGTGCVPSGGAATNIVLYGVSGACAPAPDANVTLGTLSLGATGSVLGTLTLFGSSSGSASLNGGTTGVFTSSANWALTGKFTTVQGSPPTAPFILSANSDSTPPAIQNNTMLYLISGDATNSFIDMDTFGTNASPALQGRAARGTATTPTATQTSDILLGVYGKGYNGSAYPASATGQIQIFSGGAWTTSSEPTNIGFFTTQVNAVAPPIQTMILTAAGNLAFTATGANFIPVVSACGTNPAIDTHATSNSGTVTVGTVAAASCTVTFATNAAFSQWNHCRVTPQTALATFGYSYTKTAITVTATSLLNEVFDYNCDGN